jgi:Holliday junction DNA helicase RuvA
VIALLRGRVAAKGKDWIVVDTGGVGYRVSVPPDLVARDVGEEVVVHTRLVVREDDLQLYGFSTAAEEALFSLLLTVSGVGPRVALGLLTDMRPDVFFQAVAEEDVARLTRAPGVGRKTAERILLELKEKVAERAAGPGDDPAAAALVALGVAPAEAHRLLKDTAGTVEERVRIALRRLGGDRG